MLDFSDAIMMGLLGVVVIAAAVVFIGRVIGRRMERTYGRPGQDYPLRYELDPEVRLDPELYARVRDLMKDGGKKRAVALLRGANKGRLGRRDAAAIAEGIESGAVRRPRPARDDVTE